MAREGNHTICALHAWTCRGTDGFLGPDTGQGLGEKMLRVLSVPALILMGDWCGPSYGAVLL